jgi:ATP-dependent RNA helicase DeaD
MRVMSSPENPTFASLGLRAELVDTLTTLGYEAPTPIQERTIPRLLAGKDLIGQAQTGTGKTAAFALPILERIDPKRKQTQALVLCPTRELAVQVAEAIHKYSMKMEHVSVLPLYGGAPIVPQLKRLERGAHVVVGTPGRLIDHLDRKSLDLSNIRVIVLDEADEMLKMGFIEDIERILSASPESRQTALFSATMPDEVLRIAKRHLREPERVEIERPTVTAPDIEQRFLNVAEGQKLEVLTQILELQPAEAVLIFRRTKTGSADLAEKLEARGFAAVAMHGDMSQPLRESVIRRLKAGQVEIVVATDVAARGLDVEQIEHVINYDIPYDVEAYVHRIGRTGRAGRTGLATLFITPRERGMMRAIERYTGSQIKPMKMPTRADVAARRIQLFKDTLRKTIEEGDLDMYVELVEKLAEEGPFDVADIAAAAVKIANAGRALPKAAEPEQIASDTSSYAPSPSAARDTREPAHSPTIRLSLAVGRNDGIRPADIVGSIANEADVPGRDIGPIEIRDDITYVGIPEHYVETVLAKVGKKKFRGRTLNIRVATDAPPPERRPRAPFGASRPPAPSGARPSRPREYAPRREEDARPPRAPYRDSRPAPRDSRPPSRDSRPPARDSRPPARSTRDDSRRPTTRPRRDDAGGEGPRKPFYERGGFKGGKKGR